MVGIRTDGDIVVSTNYLLISLNLLLRVSCLSVLGNPANFNYFPKYKYKHNPIHSVHL